MAAFLAQQPNPCAFATKESKAVAWGGGKPMMGFQAEFQKWPILMQTTLGFETLWNSSSMTCVSGSKPSNSRSECRHLLTTQYGVESVEMLRWLGHQASPGSSRNFRPSKAGW